MIDHPSRILVLKTTICSLTVWFRAHGFDNRCLLRLSCAYLLTVQLANGLLIFSIIR